MRLSKTTYYADFVIYAVLVATVCLTAIWRDGPHAMAIWLQLALIGVLSWTLLEYILHRFVLHRIPVFAFMHDAHHQVPLAFVGTPTWLSLAVIGGCVFLPAWALGSLNPASGLTVGVMAGFLWYGIVHHAIHYRSPRSIARRLLEVSRRHARHHYSPQPGNFGVTTAFWDRIFGTALSAAANRQVRAESPATDRPALGGRSRS
jgi:sterol desaturase/sphingolipid hydroxylase (fatty acid hydroxylase superfamily)